MKIPLRTIEPFIPLYDPSHPAYGMRYKVYKGGRGGRKSWEFAQAALYRGMREKLLILCTREIQNSIADSIHSLLSNTIERLGLTEFYEVQKTVILGKNGTEFKFRGLNGNTIDSIKSFEGADICIVEEAHSVSQKSWDILIPTIRKEGSEIWVGYNPDLATDPVHVRFAINTPENCYLQHVNYTDNPDCPQTLLDEAAYLQKVDYDAYAHIYLGEVRQHSDAQIFKGKYSVESFEVDDTFGPPLYGNDWGSVDPTTMVRCFVKGDSLYIRNEAYKTDCNIGDLPSLFDRIPNSRIYTVRADNARPELIKHINRGGFKFEPVDKWPGSIDDGIAYMRKFTQIIIHPDCKHTAEEFRLYSYKIDKRTGDVLPGIVDKHNHCIDAIRYALSPLIKFKPKSSSTPRTAPHRHEI